MKRITPVAVLLVLFAGGMSCHSRRNDMKQGQSVSSVSHDAHALGLLLRLPATPLEVAFDEVPLGTPGGFGPTDYLLVAVVRFDASTAGRLAEKADVGASGPSQVSDVPVRPWFPAAVQAKLVSQGAAGTAVRGRAIDAEAIYRPRYSTGFAVAVEGTDYILVVAQTS